MSERGVKWQVFVHVDCAKKSGCPIAGVCEKIGYVNIGTIRTSDNRHGDDLVRQRGHLSKKLIKGFKFKPCTDERNPYGGGNVEIKLSGQSNKPPKYEKLGI